MSSWRDVQETNGNINACITTMNDVRDFIKAKRNDEDLDTDIVDLIDQALGLIEDQKEILRMGYLDSGYQYDDHDPRNQMDLYDDNYYERTRARHGTNAKDEMLAEIAREVAIRHWSDTEEELYENVPGLKEHMSDMNEYRSECCYSDYADDDRSW